MSIPKLNVLLAKTDHLGASFREAIKGYIHYFDKSQTAFKGEKKTYIPKEGMIDEPGKRDVRLVVTTVDKKLQWLEDNSKEYVDALFSLEKTNASGVGKASLIVEGKSWGEYTSMELLRLKSFLENGDLKKMYETIPVRTEHEIWSPADEENFKGPGVFQTQRVESVAKTTVKQPYILQDPNLDKIDGAKYMPQTVARDQVIELADTTYQKFSGEWNHIQRASLLRRHHVLLTAVVEALKKSNDVAAIESEMTSKKIFDYLHRGVEKD